MSGPTTPGGPVVVMGVSGSGKSTVGAALARSLGTVFQDGDALHGVVNLAKLSAGEPLTDADRWPWLDRVAAWMAAHQSGVVACSALRRAYRVRLQRWSPDAVFVLLSVDRDELTRRLTGRAGHFMPPSLLGSQLDTLEPLGDDERGLTLDGRASVDELVESVVAYLRSST